MAHERLQARILGSVQGVGFRPFVYRLATQLELTGWIQNDPSGVTLEVEGSHERLLEFLSRLHSDKPPAAVLFAVDHRFLPPAGFTRFEIRESESTGVLQAWILPDLATCPDCRNDFLDDPSNRRRNYPFTNCTNCGPRFTIIEALPYDRPNTAMKHFPMCETCNREYHDPADRRFHAQPNACAACGPQLLFRAAGIESRGDDALQQTADWLRAGRIVAVKGLGGYHLVVDARNETAVAELRSRKKRRNKPFAVMFPDLQLLEAHVDVPAFARPFLSSTQAPVLLLPRTAEGHTSIAPSVAPHSPYLGVFLPYAPVHHLLLSRLNFPVVATSGNVSEEPIQFDDENAARELGRLCDGILSHNRPIVHHADDSVIHVVQKPEPRMQMLRRARGYTPFPVLATRELPPLLALGAHLNSTFAISRGREIILSQHLGDLENFESRVLYENTLREFLRLYNVKPLAVAHDMHPDYFTTRLALSLKLPAIAVQHHHAHMAACMLENQVDGPAVAITWDGTGYGTDRTVWGGEFLTGGAGSFERYATLRPFRLPGGEIAVEETWRTGLSLLQETFGNEIPRDLPLFKQAPSRSIQTVLQIAGSDRLSPITTSVGRLFDGVSAILGLCYHNSHQAEAAQLLEYAAWRHGEAPPLQVEITQGPPLRLDWRNLVHAITTAFLQGAPVEELAAIFHCSLSAAALHVVLRSGLPTVLMAGGVFCNRYLTEHLCSELQDAGLTAHIHSQLPPTDGSISAGQLWVASQNFVVK